MARSDVNPWEWSKAFGFSQAVALSNPGQLLICAGQTAIGEDGSPPTATDMGDQVRTAFANLATVLRSAGLAPTDVVRLNYYTTDVDELVSVLGPIAGEFLGGTLPASTLVGVTRLAYPQLKVEIEAIAAR